MTDKVVGGDEVMESVVPRIVAVRARVALMRSDTKGFITPDKITLCVLTSPALVTFARIRMQSSLVSVPFLNEREKR